MQVNNLGSFVLNKQDRKENKLTDRLTHSSNNWYSNKQTIILICKLLSTVLSYCTLIMYDERLFVLKKTNNKKPGVAGNTSVTSVLGGRKMSTLQ